MRTFPKHIRITGQASWQSNRCGAAAVELAVILPTLLLIVLGCVDYGRIAATSITLNNAVGSAAEYGASHRFTESTKADWETRVGAVIEEALQQGHEGSAQELTLSIATVTDDDESVHVTIDAHYPFQTVVDWPGIPNLTLLHQTLTVTQYR